MIDFTVGWMITNNITKLDLAQSKSDDYNKFEEDEQVLIIKLLELNNRLVKALRELRAATHMQESRLFLKMLQMYIKDTMMRIFLRRRFINNVILVLKNI